MYAHYQRILMMMMIIAYVGKIASHASGFEAYAYAIYTPRCPFCGYKYSHPIVAHNIAYKGKECGWR